MNFRNGISALVPCRDDVHEASRRPTCHSLTCFEVTNMNFLSWSDLRPLDFPEGHSNMPFGCTSVYALRVRTKGAHKAGRRSAKYFRKGEDGHSFEVNKDEGKTQPSPKPNNHGEGKWFISRIESAFRSPGLGRVLGHWNSSAFFFLRLLLLQVHDIAPARVGSPRPALRIVPLVLSLPRR